MRLIDADAYAYNLSVTRCNPSGDYEDELREAWEMVNSETDAPTVNAIIIPDNATNGDVIKAMFPDIFVKEDPTNEDLIMVDDLSTYTFFYKKWWNAPYKRGE